MDGFIPSLCEVMSVLNRHERDKLFPVQQLPPDYTETEKIIHKMLIENTGAHILDSGDLYGRHWEKNRAIQDFRKVPRTSIEVWDDEVFIQYNVFHYLNDHLEYDRDMDRLFHKFASSPEYRDEAWLTCMENFVSLYLELPDYAWYTVNTYNYENILSQVLQYTVFNLKGRSEFYEDCYVILQVHNGCDVRGGYSTPHVFKVMDIDYFMMAQRDITATCSKCGTYWISDDAGYHWYGEGSSANEMEDYGEWILDTENNRVFHKECGGEITFSVLHGI